MYPLIADTLNRLLLTSFPPPLNATGIRPANIATSLEMGLEDYGGRRPGTDDPSGPIIVDSELFLKLLACSI